MRRVRQHPGVLASFLHVAGNLPELVDRCGQAQGGALRHGGCRRRQHRARRPVHHRVPVGFGGCCPGDGDKRGPWRRDPVPLFRTAELEHAAPGSPAYRRAGFGARLRERLVGACLEPLHVACVDGLQLPADGLYRSRWRRDLRRYPVRCVDRGVASHGLHGRLLAHHQLPLRGEEFHRAQEPVPHLSWRDGGGGRADHRAHAPLRVPARRGVRGIRPLPVRDDRRRPR